MTSQTLQTQQKQQQSQRDPYFAKLERGVREMHTDPDRLAFVIQVKRDTERMQGSLRDSSTFKLMEARLKDVPTGLKCDCCGRMDLLRTFPKGNAKVGRECIKESEMGSCRRRMK